MKKLIAAAALLSLASFACTDRGLKDPAVKEGDPPALNVEKPLRGTVLPETATTLVEGTVFDAGSGVDTVMVNGEMAFVMDDGRFEAHVDLDEGVTLVQVVATDNDGNESVDTRAVLQGTFVPSETPVQNAAAARVNDQTLGAIGDITAEVITETDLGAAAAPFNPMLDKGFSCLNVQLSVDDLQKSLVVIDLVPTWGGIAVSADVYDLDVPMTADFEAVCINGSAGVDLTASRFHMEGTMLLSVDANDRLAADIQMAMAYFDDFNLDVGVIPGSVIELFYAEVDDLVAGILVDQIAEKVPAMIEQQFGGFGIEKSVTLYGMEIGFGVKPVSVDFTPQGGTIVLDSRIEVKDDGAGGPGYLWTPAALPLMPSSEAPGDGFRLALADDVVNQALAAFWAAGVFEHSIVSGDDSSSGLGALVDRVDITMPFPPTVAAAASGPAAGVTAGDLRLNIVRIDPATGEEQVVTALAMSAEIGLDVETDATGAVRLQTGSPLAWIDVLDEGVTGPNILSDEEVELLGSFVAARLSTMIGGIVNELPIPSFDSAAIVNVGTQPANGYVMLGGNVQPL